LLPVLMLSAFGAMLLAQDVASHNIKEGLWSQHLQFTENPGNKKRETTQTVCRTHAYDIWSRDRSKKRAGCKVISENSTAASYTIEMECTVQGSVIKSKTVATFSGDTAVHSESHSTQTPPLMGIAESTAISDDKYVGPCPAGAQPGDITMENGAKINTYKK